jgi:acetylornithine deacetylase/succinyl-diaminopimelate desuccinylase-like protein
VLEIAEAFTKLPTPPKRSVLFMMVTAEEKGLLGAKYYAEHPLYPLAKTLADINIDGVNQWGKHERHNAHRPRQLYASTTWRPPPRRLRGAHAHARPRAAEGLLLPLRPLRVR